MPNTGLEKSVARRNLKYKQRTVQLKKACTQPDFEAPTVLVADPWRYVDLWLRRRKMADARFYWQQGKEFFDAAHLLPPTASPLPAYYCLLNCTKALLVAKGVSFSRHHGVTGWRAKGKRGLRAEKIEFKGGGVLPALGKYLGETSGPGTQTLYEVLYNLPFIHRAFTLTFTTAKDLFLPISDPHFVVKVGSAEAWFEATLTNASGHSAAKLPTGYEVDAGAGNGEVIRKKKRFKWSFTKAAEKENVRRLCEYHRSVRQRVCYIYGPSRLWYLKRKRDGAPDYVDRLPLSLTFAAMHRLSELARYEPLTLVNHFEAQQNWLLTEFIEVAPRQFVDEIAAELTGRDFMVPGIRK